MPRKFDRESGQIYEESVVAAKSCSCGRSLRSWYLGAIPFTTHPGARTKSLEDMAMRTLMRSLSMLEVASLRTVPLPMLEKIWTVIRGLGLDDVRMWTLFAEAGALTAPIDRVWSGSAEYCRIHGHSLSIRSITSNSMHWIVHLEISTLSCLRRDLVGISGMVNVRSIIIQADRSNQYCFTDSVLREWAVAARVSSALGQLQMLFAEGHIDITHWALQHLSSFKNLDKFAASNCGIQQSAHEEAVQLGWKDCRELHPSVRTYQANGWVDIVRDNIARHRSSGIYADDKLPCMDFRLSMPLAAMHVRHDRIILDNFICLERDRGSETSKRPADDRQGSHIACSNMQAKRRKVKEERTMDLNQFLMGV